MRQNCMQFIDHVNNLFDINLFTNLGGFCIGFDIHKLEEMYENAYRNPGLQPQCTFSLSASTCASLPVAWFERESESTDYRLRDVSIGSTTAKPWQGACPSSSAYGFVFAFAMALLRFFMLR